MGWADTSFHTSFLSCIVYILISFKVCKTVSIFHYYPQCLSLCLSHFFSIFSHCVSHSISPTLSFTISHSVSLSLAHPLAHTISLWRSVCVSSACLSVQNS